MEDYLQGIKRIADSLATIVSTASDMDLVQLTLNGADEDYHTLATILAYGTNLPTLNCVCAKLIHYEQCLKLLSPRGPSLQHRALVEL